MQSSFFFSKKFSNWFQLMELIAFKIQFAKGKREEMQSGIQRKDLHVRLFDFLV